MSLKELTRKISEEIGDCIQAEMVKIVLHRVICLSIYVTRYLSRSLSLSLSLSLVFYISNTSKSAS